MKLAMELQPNGQRLGQLPGQILRLPNQPPLLVIARRLVFLPHRQGVLSNVDKAPLTVKHVNTREWISGTVMAQMGVVVAGVV